MNPSDAELEDVLAAVEAARAAGVSETEIDAVLSWAATGEPRDEFWEPLTSGRLLGLARMARMQANPPPVRPFADSG